MIAKRFFNNTGLCNPEYHYMLSPEERLVGAQLDRYIRDKLYWVLHAPRQCCTLSQNNHGLVRNRRDNEPN